MEDEAPVRLQDEASIQTFKQPKLNLESKPSVLASIPAETGPQSDNFWRNAKWSPDGSCVLTQEENRLAKIFALPTELVDITNLSLRQHLALPAAPAALLGLEWFPYASLLRPETFCFMKSVRDLPVQLIDGNTGRVRASYSIIDHQERFVGPNSMTFSPDGTKLYSGFENAIECFDVANPGATGTRHMLSPSRKAKQGQKGLISAIAISPDNSGLMAAGSFTKSLYLYDASGGEPRLIRSLKSKDPSHRGAGVTQVKFHPTMPNYVYSTSRRMNHILMWDIRNPSDIMLALPRPGNTHQRIQFDIDPWGKWLTTGDTNGNVRVYDTEDPDGDIPIATWHMAEGRSRASSDCFVADMVPSSDTVNTAMLHPLQPILLTASGSRHLPVARRIASDSDSSSESDSDDDSDDSSSTLGEREGQSLHPDSNTTSSPLKSSNVAKSTLSLWSLK